MLPIFPYKPYNPHTYMGNHITQKVINAITGYGREKNLGDKSSLMSKFWNLRFSDPSKQIVDEELLILFNQVLNESI